MKKLLLVLLILLLCSVSTALGYGYGSNLYGMYPAFNTYLPYNPDRDDVERYTEEARKYVQNGDNDISSIQQAQREAIRKANQAVNDYNRNNSRY